MLLILEKLKKMMFLHHRCVGENFTVKWIKKCSLKRDVGYFFLQ